MSRWFSGRIVVVAGWIGGLLAVGGLSGCATPTTARIGVPFDANQARARLAPGQPLPRIGAKGTARIEARDVSVGYWLLRKPWAAARAWLGW